MVDNDPSVRIHSLDLAGILQGVYMMDSSLEDENLHHNVIDCELQKRIHLISHVASDVGVGYVIRRRGHVERLRS